MSASKFNPENLSRTALGSSQERIPEVTNILGTLGSILGMVRFWLGVVCLLACLWGLFNLGSFAFSLLEDARPVEQLAAKVNLDIDANMVKAFGASTVDIIEALKQGKKTRNGKTKPGQVETPESVSDQTETAEVEMPPPGPSVVASTTSEVSSIKNHTGSSFIIACLFFISVLKLLVSILIKVAGLAVKLIN